MQVVLSAGSVSAEDAGRGGGGIHPAAFPFALFTETCLGGGAPFSSLPPALTQNTALFLSSLSGRSEVRG